MSTDDRPRRYKIPVTGTGGISIVTQDAAQLPGAESRAGPVTVRVPEDKGKADPNTVTSGLHAQGDERFQAQEKAVFYVPQ